MKAKLTLDQTIRYSKMLRQGADPEMMRRHAMQEARERAQTVATQLQQRQQAVESEIGGLINRAEAVDLFGNVKTEQESLEKRLEHIKKASRVLNDKLIEDEEALKKQHLQKKQAEQAMREQKRVLESTASRSEMALEQFGRGIWNRFRRIN